MDPRRSEGAASDDVQQPLAIYITEGDCNASLASLPLFWPREPLGGVADDVETAIDMLVGDAVTSAAALQVRTFMADTMV